MAEVSRYEGPALARAVADVMVGAEASSSFGELSPMVQVGVQITSMAVESLGATALATLPDVVRDVIGEVASVVGEVAEMVPMFGAIVGLSIDLGGSATAITDEAARSHCSRVYRPVVSTGANGRIMPCDYFVSSIFRKNGAFVRYERPTLAMTLIAASEYEGNVKYLREHSNQKKLGIPNNTRAELQKARHVIESSWRAGGDGGALVWPLWLDIMRAQYDARRMTDDYARYLSIYAEGLLFDKGKPQAMHWAYEAFRWYMQNVPPTDGEARIMCGRYDDRSRLALAEMIRVWRNTAYAAYAVDDGRRHDVNTRAIAAAAKKLRVKPRPILARRLVRKPAAGARFARVAVPVAVVSTVGVATWAASRYL